MNPSSLHSNPLNTTFPIQAHPKIKPIIRKYPQGSNLDSKNLQKYLKYYPKAFKSIASNPERHRNSSIKSANNLIKTLKNQGSLSRLDYSFNNNMRSENLYLSSRIRNLSCLSCLQLKFSDNPGTNNPPGKLLMKSVNSLKNLSQIKLQFNSYHFQDSKYLHTLFQGLSRIKKLRDLSLNFVRCPNFQGPELDIIILYLGKMKQLRSLHLNFDRSLRFYDHDLDDLASVLPKLENLTQIDLNLSGERGIQGSTLIGFFKSFRKIKTLSEITLNLRSCEISHKYDTESLAEGLKCLDGSSLKKLHLYFYRNFDEKSLIKISKALQKFTEISTLCLNFSSSLNITNEGIKELGSALKGFPEIQALSLIFPSITEADCILESIACALLSLEELTSLQLDFARIENTTPGQILSLFTSVKTLTCLEYLEISLSHQRFVTDMALESLAQSLKELVQLRKLLLNFNCIRHISNKGVEAISSAVKGMSGLSGLVLNLGNNEQIDEKAVDKIVQALRCVPSLRSVNFSFIRCAKIMKKEDSLLRLFGALRDLRNIYEVYLGLSHSDLNEQETNALRLQKSLQTFWI